MGFRASERKTLSYLLLLNAKEPRKNKFFLVGARKGLLMFGLKVKQKVRDHIKGPWNYPNSYGASGVGGPLRDQMNLKQGIRFILPQWDMYYRVYDP